MRNRGFAPLLLLVAGLTLVTGCSPSVPAVPPITLEVEDEEAACTDTQTGAALSFEEALTIAGASACVTEGTLLDTYVCNEGTGTIWIDLEVDRPGCNPACVVDVNTGAAEINWRCTGAVPEGETATPTASPEPTATLEPATTPTPTATPEPLADWPRYVNEGYGFSFRYPPGWEIELLALEGSDQGAVNAVRLTQETLEIRVEFKSPEASILVGPGTLPDGEIVERGRVSLFGREIPRQVLLYEGKDKLAFVGERLPDLELYIEMRDDHGEDYADAEIPAEAHEDFDRMVGSFTRIGPAATVDAFPGWLHYSQPDVGAGVGFSFRYPDDWELTELMPDPEAPVAKALELRKATHLLRVEYKSSNAEESIGPATMPEGVISEAGTATFLGQPTERYVLVDEGDLKVIFLNYRDEAVEFYVALTEDTDFVAYEDVHIPEEIRQEMDLILTSFELTAP